ncbi:splicing factor [Blyttiomyces sp. JEL0837]|nr:splicing factor [Blyttiomyces sp. JEL0837]
MAAEQRKLLEALMGKEALGGIPDTVKFTDGNKVDLGACPKTHSEKLKKEYDNAVTKKEHHGFEEEWTRNLLDFIADCDRKIEQARKRLEKTPEDAKAAQLFKEVDDLSNEIAELTSQVEKLGEEGNVDESLEILRQVEELQKTKMEKERDLKVMAAADANSQHQKLRVCGICSAYLSIFDSDRRLADHFQGKMHLGFKQIRDKLEELQQKGFGQGRRGAAMGGDRFDRPDYNRGDRGYYDRDRGDRGYERDGGRGGQYGRRDDRGYDRRYDDRRRDYHPRDRERSPDGRRRY